MRATVGTRGILILGLTLAACGGGGSPSAASLSPSLSALGRIAIAQQIVTTALGGVATGSALKKSDGVPLGSLSCQKTCAGSSCVFTCPIDERFDCPSGGSATDKGQVAGTLDAELTGEAALAATQGYSACKPNAGLTIDGAPSTTATGNARFAKGQLADEQTVRIAGAVSYASTTEGSGQCAVDIRVTFSRSLKGSASGTACGQTVDVSF
jgi:hypothetical protein